MRLFLLSLALLPSAAASSMVLREKAMNSEENELRASKLNSFELPEMLKLTAPDGAEKAIASEAQAEDTRRMLSLRKRNLAPGDNGNGAENGNPSNPRSENAAGYGSDKSDGKSNGQGKGSTETCTVDGIFVDGMYLPVTQSGLDIMIDMSNIGRPDAFGQLLSTSPVNGYLEGEVTFTDEKTYELNYKCDESTIYWDGKKGDTKNIWYPTEPCTVDGIFVDGMHLPVTQSGLDIMIDMSNIGRPDAFGQLLSTSPVNGYLEGEVTFTDEKTYELNYKCDESTIYWDGKKGDTENIWYPTEPCTVDGVFVDGMYLTVTQSGLDIMIDMSNLDRPDAFGQLLSTSPVNGYLKGEVYFTDDKTYELNYKCDESTIYWDGKKGITINIWYPITPVKTQSPL